MTEQVDVGVIMGSQSDWPTMKHAAKILEQLEITHACQIVSAHRTPDRLVDYAKTARTRGLKVIIAGAGGAGEGSAGESASAAMLLYRLFLTSSCSLEISLPIASARSRIISS